MNNVIHLPDSMQRQWGVYERKLRAHFLALGAGPEELAYALDRLKPIYLEASAPASFAWGDGVSPEQFVENLNTWVQTQISDLMCEVVVRDIELHRLRGPVA